MKATEAIQRLHDLIRLHGDLEIRIWNSLENEFDSVDDIEPRRFLPDQRASDEERGQIYYGIAPYSIGDWSAQLRYDDDEDN